MIVDFFKSLPYNYLPSHNETVHLLYVKLIYHTLSGSRLVEPDFPIPYENLAQNPIQIQTNSAAGSNDILHLELYGGEKKLQTAGIIIYFESTLKFSIEFCKGPTGFHNRLPPSDVKLWTMTFVMVESNPKIQIKCNDILLLDLQVSMKTCDHDSRWKEILTTTVTEIKFAADDNASDYYRPYHGKKFEFLLSFF